MTIYRMLFVCAILLCPCFVSAADDDLAEKLKTLDQLLSQKFTSDGPGAAVLVIENGKKVFEKCYGLADVAKQIPITPQTNFELASCTKQFTAMAIMMLAEAGKLCYDDHLSKFFPEFGKAGDEITITHLLHHTSGLDDYFTVFEKFGKGKINSQHVMDVLAKHGTPHFKPGDKYEYSNSGYMVLAQIVEKASGKRYAEFLKQKIFAPLQMNSTLVYDDSCPLVKDCAECYNRSKTGAKKMEHDDWDCVYGDGSVRSTLDDLYKWDQALYAESLFKQSTLQLAWTEGKLNNGEGSGYGFGWVVSAYKKNKSVWHNGQWLGFRTLIYRIPELHFSVIILSNGSFGETIDECVREVLKTYRPGV